MAKMLFERPMLKFVIADIPNLFRIFAIIIIPFFYSNPALSKNIFRATDENDWSISKEEGLCGANRNVNNTNASLILTIDGNFYIGFSNSKIKFVIPDKKYKIYISFDAGTRAPIEFYGLIINGNRVLTSYRSSDALRSEVAKSSRLAAEYRGKTLVNISLKGTSAALSALDECIKQLPGYEPRSAGGDDRTGSPQWKFEGDNVWQLGAGRSISLGDSFSRENLDWFLNDQADSIVFTRFEDCLYCYTISLKVGGSFYIASTDGIVINQIKGYGPPFVDVRGMRSGQKIRKGTVMSCDSGDEITCRPDKTSNVNYIIDNRNCKEEIALNDKELRIFHGCEVVVGFEVYAITRPTAK